MSKKYYPESLTSDHAFWKRVSGRKDKYGDLIQTLFERKFPDPQAVDLAIDLGDERAIGLLADWVPRLEEERIGWADRKLRYVLRALARPRDRRTRALVRAAVDAALARGSDSAALRGLSRKLGPAITIAWATAPVQV